MSIKTLYSINPSRFGVFAASVLLASLTLVLSSGCQTMQLPTSTTAMATAEDASVSGEMYRVQLDPRFGRTTLDMFPLQSGMTVSDALESCGAFEKFRAMEITLSRVVQGSGQVLRLPVTYDVASRSVVSHENYAIHPGDTISIKAKASASMDSLMDSITGAMM